MPMGLKKHVGIQLLILNFLGFSFNSLNQTLGDLRKINYLHNIFLYTPHNMLNPIINLAASSSKYSKDRYRQKTLFG